MNPLLLVHGAWHANWCWEKLLPRLQSSQRKIIAPNLPGHDPNLPQTEKMTLENYVEAICGWIRMEQEPVTLVGHSMGGMVISQVSELLPDRVKHLVYLSGFLPKNGQSMMDLVQSQMHAPPPFDLSQDGSKAIIKQERACEIFYSDCEESVAQASIRRLIPQNVLPFSTPVQLTAEKFGTVPKSYILCLEDRSLWPETQQKMLLETPCNQVIHLKSGHCPFLSQPEALAALLNQL